MSRNIGTPWRGGLAFSKPANLTTDYTFTRFDASHESPWAWLKAQLKEMHMSKMKKGKGKSGGGKKC